MISLRADLVMSGGVRFEDGHAVTFFSARPGYRRSPPAMIGAAKAIRAMHEDGDVALFSFTHLGDWWAISKPFVGPRRTEEPGSENIRETTANA